eukprot:TRINITY_DN71086_c0_g2_i1.p1 TRINITY_DN71086_c0_g2~~TRINITY_DN71086_c0_g2_i1.p1  ORF type:complete len:196 (-),score=14.32 TRINITY_DN71086_c0_g2_i1:175-762(-)
MNSDDEASSGSVQGGGGWQQSAHAVIYEEEGVRGVNSTGAVELFECHGSKGAAENSDGSYANSYNDGDNDNSYDDDSDDSDRVQAERSVVEALKELMAAQEGSLHSIKASHGSHGGSHSAHLIEGSRQSIGASSTASVAAPPVDVRGALNFTGEANVISDKVRHDHEGSWNQGQISNELDELSGRLLGFRIGCDS